MRAHVATLFEQFQGLADDAAKIAAEALDRVEVAERELAEMRSKQASVSPPPPGLSSAQVEQVVDKLIERGFVKRANRKVVVEGILQEGPAALLDVMDKLASIIVAPSDFLEDDDGIPVEKQGNGPRNGDHDDIEDPSLKIWVEAHGETKARR